MHTVHHPFPGYYDGQRILPSAPDESGTMNSPVRDYPSTNVSATTDPEPYAAAKADVSPVMSKKSCGA